MNFKKLSCLHFSACLIRPLCRCRDEHLRSKRAATGGSNFTQGTPAGGVALGGSGFTQLQAPSHHSLTALLQEPSLGQQTCVSTLNLAQIVSQAQELPVDQVIQEGNNMQPQVSEAAAPTDTSFLPVSKATSSRLSVCCSPTSRSSKFWPPSPCVSCSRSRKTRRFRRPWTAT
jgi:hypothetical protein